MLTRPSKELGTYSRCCLYIAEQNNYSCFLIKSKAREEEYKQLARGSALSRALLTVHFEHLGVESASYIRLYGSLRSPSHLYPPPSSIARSGTRKSTEPGNCLINPLLTGGNKALHFALNQSFLASQVAQWWRIRLPMQETWVRSLNQKDPLEEEMASHSSIPAWRIPWTENPGGLQSMGSKRVGHNLETKQQQNLLRLPHLSPPMETTVRTLPPHRVLTPLCLLAELVLPWSMVGSPFLGSENVTLLFSLPAFLTPNMCCCFPSPTTSSPILQTPNECPQAPIILPSLTYRKAFSGLWRFQGFLSYLGWRPNIETNDALLTSITQEMTRVSETLSETGDKDQIHISYCIINIL